jgi:hypothetical protein
MTSEPPVPVRSHLPTGACIGVSPVPLAGIFTGAGMAAKRIAADMAEQWSLVGSWAVDCQRPPARENPHYSYLRQGVTLMVQRDVGDFRDENKVTSAAITDDGGIELVTDFKALSHVITSRYAKHSASQFRAISNKDEKNVYSARDGKLRSGVPTPVMSRCSKADRE